MSRVGRFLRSVFLADILRGLAVTLRLYFSRKVTVEFPEKVQAPAERFRGLLRLHRDENGEPLCIACKACQRACGQNCFDIEGKKEEGAKVMRPTKFDWKLDRCSFCGLCVEVCPTNAIRHSHEFLLTGARKEALFFRLDGMYLTGEALQDHLCGGCRRDR
ncbi:MAG TPA: NADH-quinone oxidoreductase subunit I [Candidatus Aminicenantes bacterium]|nr:NADH-quinone oxidoreductase subunit I [Candidatus Aminicenantes bacterium]